MERHEPTFIITAAIAAITILFLAIKTLIQWLFH